MLIKWVIIASGMGCMFRGSHCLNQCWLSVKTLSIRHTRSQNFNVSRLVLQFSLLNPPKPCVKSRMQMYRWLEQRQQAMLRQHLSDQPVYAYLGATYIRGLTVLSILIGLQWNLILNIRIFLQGNALKNVVWETIILFSAYFIEYIIRSLV